MTSYGEETVALLYKQHITTDYQPRANLTARIREGHNESHFLQNWSKCCVIRAKVYFEADCAR